MSPLRPRSSLRTYESTGTLTAPTPVLNYGYEQTDDCSASQSIRSTKNPFGRRAVLRWRTRPSPTPQRCTPGDEDMISTTSSSSTAKVSNPITLGSRMRRWRVPILRKHPVPKPSPAHSISQNSTQNTLGTTCSQRSIHASPVSDCTESNENCEHALVSRIISNTTARLTAISDASVLVSRQHDNACDVRGDILVTRSKSDKIHHVTSHYDENDEEMRLRASPPGYQLRNGTGDRSRLFKRTISSCQERRNLYKALSSNSSVANHRMGVRESRRIGSSLRRLSLRKLMDSCDNDEDGSDGWTDGTSQKWAGITPPKDEYRPRSEKASIDGTSFQTLLKQLQGTKAEGVKYNCDVGQESPWGLKGEELKESREHSVVGKMVKAVWRGWKDGSSDRSSNCESDDDNDGSDLDLNLDTQGFRTNRSDDDRFDNNPRHIKPPDIPCREIELTQDDFIDFCSPSSNSRSRSVFQRRVKLISPR